MRTCSYNLLDPIIFHCLNNLHRLHLEEHLISRPACRIARAGFFLSENGIADIQSVQNSGESPYHLFITIVVSSRATDPEKVFRLRSGRQFREHGNFKIKILCPVKPVFRRILPWSPVIFDIAENTFKFTGSLTLLKYQVASHIDYN